MFTLNEQIKENWNGDPLRRVYLFLNWEWTEGDEGSLWMDSYTMTEP